MNSSTGTTMRLAFTTLLSYAVTMLVIASTAVAGSYQLNYSGRLTDASGKPVTGPVNLDVSFYRLDEGGPAVTVTVPDFDAVELAHGAFALDLALSPGDYHTLFDGTQDVWIEVKDVTNDRVYPRQRFGAVPYALKVPVDGTTLGYNASGELEVLTAPAAASATTAGHATTADSATTAATATSAEQINSIPIESGAPADGKILKYSDANDRWEFADDAGALGSGESNTGSSLGGDANIFKLKNLVDLQFRGISAGTGIDVTQNANDITIAMEAIDADDVAETAGKKWLTAAEQTKLSGVATGADDVNTTTVAAAGAVMDGDFGSNGIMLRTGAGAYSVLADNSTNWNAAYTSVNANAANWTTAFGWGNHASANYLADGDFTANGLMTRTAAGVYSNITDNSANWNTAYGWGNHATPGYLTAAAWATPGTIGSTTPNTATFSTLQANTYLRLRDVDTNYVQLQAPALGANYTLTLPVNDGNNLDVLQTNGTGLLSWVPIPSAPVTTVNGASGVVVLDASNISPTATRLWLSDTAQTDYNAAYTDRLKWDGGATGLNATNARTNLGLVIGTNVQAYDATLTGMAATNTVADQMIYSSGVNAFTTTGLTAAGRALLDDADAATQRGTLGLTIGTNVQAYDATLAGMAATNTVADQLIYSSGVNAFTTTGLTAAGRALLDDADDAAQRTTLGLGTLAQQNANAVSISGGTLTSVTLTTPTIANDAISGDKIHAGTISAFASTGIDDNAAATAMTIDAAGDVGVGTASPDAKLHVAGDVKIGNSAALCNATTEGSVRYNATTKVLQFCNATTWVTPGGNTVDYILITDERAASVTTTIAAGAWRTRALNTEKADTGNHATLSANQVTLLAGKYRCLIVAGSYQTEYVQARLANITDGIYYNGFASHSNNEEYTSVMSMVYAYLDLAAAKTFEVQQRLSTGSVVGFSPSWATSPHAILDCVRFSN